ncbi:MAG: ArsR/SmtB family transcription factor [Woeseiaceae bacterium]
MVDLPDAAFAALANATRRDILARLATGEATVGGLADAYDMSLNAVSKHLKVLEDAGLIDRRIEWRKHHIRLNPAPLHEVAEWLERYRVFWEARLDALEEFLANRKTPAKPGARHGQRNPPVPKNRRNPR